MIHLFLFVFAHKKYSHRLINLRLSRLDYFKNIFTNVLGRQVSNSIEAHGGVRQLSDLIIILTSTIYTV